MKSIDYDTHLFRLASLGDMDAYRKLEERKAKRKQSNAQRNARAKETAEQTKGAAKAIKRHINARGLRHIHNDAMTTHRRLKIGEDVVRQLDDMPLMAIAEIHNVCIRLDKTNINKTREHQSTFHYGPQYCLRIEPGETDVQIEL